MMPDQSDGGTTDDSEPIRQMGLSPRDRLVLLVLSLLFVAATAIAWFAKSPLGSLSSREDAAIQVDVNSADIQELTLLPGVGEKTARLIVGDREARGPFKTIYHLGRVKGIGPSTIERIAPYAVCR